MKLILHLGTEKSGTTALQTWLHHNTLELQHQGVWICQSFEIPNHFGIVVMGAGLEAWPDLLNPVAVHDEGSLARYTKLKLRELDEEIESARHAGCHSFLVTSEHLHSRIRNPEQAKRISSILTPRFSDIECVLFFRPQADLSKSVQSNHIRWGKFISRDTFLETAQGHNYNYWKIYNIWKTAFSKRPLIVPYRKNPSVVDWFCNFLSINKNKTKNPRIRTKTGVTENSAAILNALTDILPLGPKFVDLRERIISQTAGGEKLTFSKADADIITQRFHDGNQKLCTEITCLALADLEPAADDYPDVGNVETLGDLDCSDVLLRIFK